VVARAQQATMPVIGFLNSELPNFYAQLALAFRQGLSDRPRSAWMASSSGFRNPVISLVEKRVTEADPARASRSFIFASALMFGSPL
jgi:hypothetical protein